MLASIVFYLAWAAVMTSGRAQSNDVELNDAIQGLVDSFGDSLFQIPSPFTGQKLEKWDEYSGVNPEELGDYPEGDILFPRANSPMSRNSLRSARRWRRGYVPYTLTGSFSSQERRLIDQAFADYAKLTCVRFVPRSTEPDYLFITSDNTGCWSSVGKTGGAQQLNLQRPGCVTKKGTVVHELMHALGFLHEQNRWERDNYVSIKYQNIIRGTESNFEKAQPKTTDGLGIEYDYGSVMHYSEFAFSSNGLPTIKAKVSCKS
uniref:Metalloendopeptidase n=1 Tax=Lygus hesperus TaxID=30085 RepID=A0A0A9YKU2_LYGHE